MPSAFGACIEAEDTMAGPRRLARHGHQAPADQPHLRNRLLGGATRPGGDDGGAPSGGAGNARDAGGVDGFRQCYHLPDDRAMAPFGERNTADDAITSCD